MKQDVGSGIDRNIVISNVLKYGVLVSIALIFIGIALLFARTPKDFPSSIGRVISTNYGRPTLDSLTLLNGVISGEPIFIIQLGLIVLLATPITRVVASVVLFAAERDELYVAITLFVLTVLLISIFIIGPVEAPTS
jgi:uncharacterized membrane protein